MNDAPTYLSLFSGVGGFDAALDRAGFVCLGQVESDPFCNRVLALRWPGVPRWNDVRTVGVQSEADGSPGQRGSIPDAESRNWRRDWPNGGRLDLLCGGWPCQDLSVAGKRAGLEGERSGLFSEVVRIAKALRPTWGLFENVPGLLSSGRGRDMGIVLAGLRECWPAVGYRVLDSRYFGVAQRRRRVFFVCGSDEQRVAEILFESEGGSGDLAASSEAGTRVAASLTSGAHGAGVSEPGRRSEDDVNLVTVAAITAREMKGPDSDATSPLVVGALREHVRPGSNTDHSVLVGTIKQRMRGATDEVIDTLVVGAGMNKERGGWRAGPDEAHAGHLVTHPLTAEGRDASEDGTGRGVPMVLAPTLNSYQGRNQVEGQYAIIPFDTTPTYGESLDSGPHGSGPDNAIVSDMTVRRLTPTECEALQAFPPGWTCLCQPIKSYNANACTCHDSPRYRALGNAVTVSVVYWLGARLASAITRAITP